MARRRIDCDGEVFEVSSGPQGTTHDTWISGPHDGYGFSSSSSSGRSPTPAEHVESIRDFLALIDRDTGYIED